MAIRQGHSLTRIATFENTATHQCNQDKRNYEESKRKGKGNGIGKKNKKKKMSRKSRYYENHVLLTSTSWPRGGGGVKPLCK